MSVSARLDAKLAKALGGQWSRLSHRAGWPEDHAELVGRDLIARLAEPQRAYHNGHHILALLGHAHSAGGLVQDPVAMSLAIWFHDIVYDPQRSDNEALSAKLALSTVEPLTGSKIMAQKVQGMVLATAQHQPAEDADDDLRLFLDFDLSILGSPLDVYTPYAEAIRQEYSFVPEDRYVAGRQAMLHNFLNRERLYFTNYGASLWERQARANLRAELRELAKP